MATRKKAPKSPTTRKAARKKGKRGKLAPSKESRGLAAGEVALGLDRPEVADLVALVSAAGGAAIGAYRDPLGGRPLLLASLPLDAILPTPFQRDLSPAHTKRLAEKIGETDAFLDPLIVVRGPDDRLWTPNGRHRLAAAKVLGMRQITALVARDDSLAYRILALNTEKAHNLKDKALEVIRMARAIAADPKRAGTSEADMAFEFELPMYLPLGVCYERNGRFSGGAYSSVVRQTVEFSTDPLAKSLKLREQQADLLLELDKHVAEGVDRLKKAGFTSGYLKAIVVGRINPLRFLKLAKDAPKPDFEKTIDKMIEGAKKFDPSKVKAMDLAIAASAGGGEAEE